MAMLSAAPLRARIYGRRAQRRVSLVPTPNPHRAAPRQPTPPVRSDGALGAAHLNAGRGSSRDLETDLPFLLPDDKEEGHPATRLVVAMLAACRQWLVAAALAAWLLMGAGGLVASPIRTADYTRTPTITSTQQPSTTLQLPAASQPATTASQPTPVAASQPTPVAASQPAPVAASQPAPVAASRPAPAAPKQQANTARSLAAPVAVQAVPAAPGLPNMDAWTRATRKAIENDKALAVVLTSTKADQAHAKELQALQAMYEGTVDFERVVVTEADLAPGAADTDPHARLVKAVKTDTIMKLPTLHVRRYLGGGYMAFTNDVSEFRQVLSEVTHHLVQCPASNKLA